MNIELLVALAAIVISAIVPAITNQQNNEHQIRLKKLDTFFLENKRYTLSLLIHMRSL